MQLRKSMTLMVAYDGIPIRKILNFSPRNYAENKKKPCSNFWCAHEHMSGAIFKEKTIKVLFSLCSKKEFSIISRLKQNKIKVVLRFAFECAHFG